MKTLTLVVSLATVAALAALVVRYQRPRVEYRRRSELWIQRARMYREN